MMPSEREQHFIKRSHLLSSSHASAHANLLKPKPEYIWRQGTSDMDELIEKIRDPMLRAQAEKVAAFYGYLSPGALVGIRMFNIACKVLDLSSGERISVTSETYNCLPDPFGVLAKATVGNKGLNHEVLQSISQ
jgi:hypothetical protein